MAIHQSGHCNSRRSRPLTPTQALHRLPCTLVLISYVGGGILQTDVNQFSIAACGFVADLRRKPVRGQVFNDQYSRIFKLQAGQPQPGKVKARTGMRYAHVPVHKIDW